MIAKCLASNKSQIKVDFDLLYALYIEKIVFVVRPPMTNGSDVQLPIMQCKFNQNIKNPI